MQAAPAAQPAHAVNAVVLTNGCAHFGKENAKLAQIAMNQLVDGCSGFSGNAVQFTAVLLPEGAIQFEGAPGDEGAQSIPICIVAHPLKHKVKLQRACRLDVRLEAGSVDVQGPQGPSGPGNGP